MEGHAAIDSDEALSTRHANNQTPVFQIAFRTQAAAFVRASQNELSREHLINLVESAHVTMRESTADFGQETIRRVSASAISSIVGLAVSSCFTREGQMVPAEIVRLDASSPIILLVEDEVLIRFSLADFLREAGFIVIEAGAAYEALTVLKVRSDVALVLTDLNMPGALDGAGLIRQIRKSYPAVKVVVASAFKTAEPVEATIAKPYSLERVLEVIKSVLTS